MTMISNISKINKSKFGDRKEPQLVRNTNLKFTRLREREREKEKEEEDKKLGKS